MDYLPMTGWISVRKLFNKCHDFCPEPKLGSSASGCEFHTSWWNLATESVPHSLRLSTTFSLPHLWLCLPLSDNQWVSVLLDGPENELIKGGHKRVGNP